MPGVRFIGPVFRHELRAAVPICRGRRLYRSSCLNIFCITNSVRAVNDCTSQTIIFSGAGGGTIHPAFFCSGPEQEARFRTIGYPGWPRYVESGFTARKLVEELAAQSVACPGGIHSDHRIVLRRTPRIRCCPSLAGGRPRDRRVLRNRYVHSNDCFAHGRMERAAP